MASEQARAIAAQCWCDETTSDIEMDARLAEVFANKIDEYLAALIWCGGSRDFGPDGEAAEGWRNVVQPLLDEGRRGR